jgi:hypothetical protein
MIPNGPMTRSPDPSTPLPDEMTRREAVALYYQRCAAIARQIAELRRLRQLIQIRWGRAPAWPQW